MEPTSQNIKQSLFVETVMPKQMPTTKTTASSQKIATQMAAPTSTGSVARMMAARTGSTQMMLGGGQMKSALAAKQASSNRYTQMFMPAPSLTPFNQPEPKAPLQAQPKMQVSSPIAPGQAAGVQGRPEPPYPVDDDGSILVQGGTLRTWSYRSPAVDQVQIVLSTEGRPLDADVELWHGPDNTPVKMRVYVENGQIRPFSAVIETPRGPNTVAVRNIGQIEFPLAAQVVAKGVDQPSQDCIAASSTIQGGALRTYPFDPSVDSVQVLLRTDGRPLNARIELLQGPNNNKQVIELYTEDGMDRPFFCHLTTPGSGNVVRIVNTAPIEFPMTAGVVPHLINHDVGHEVVLGGDTAW